MGTQNQKHNFLPEEKGCNGAHFIIPQNDHHF